MFTIFHLQQKSSVKLQCQLSVIFQEFDKNKFQQQQKFEVALPACNRGLRRIPKIFEIANSFQKE